MVEKKERKKQNSKGCKRCNTMYDPELILKEIKRTNNNRKVRDRISLEEKLSMYSYNF